MSRSSRVSPWSRRSRNSTVLWARASSLRPCISGSRAPTRGTSSANLLTFLPSPARRTFVNTLMRGTILPAATGREPPLGIRNERGLRAADLVFDPTLACREGDAPVPAVRRRTATPNGTMLARIASSPPAPDSRGRGGQGLPLSRTMLSDHKSPYVGRFACDWPRLSTTDPHAAPGHPTPGRALLPRDARARRARGGAGAGRVGTLEHGDTGDLPHPVDLLQIGDQADDVGLGRGD